MKSYKDRQLLLGLLFIGIAGGFAGRYLETEHFTFPSAGHLNQAAAILATQENIIGTPAPDPTVTLAFAETDKKLGSFSSVPDIAFSRETDCGNDMTIKTAQDSTVGFLCLDATDPNFDATIRSDAPKVNALVVSPNFGTKISAIEETAISRGALADGAAFVVGMGPKASTSIDTYNGSSIVYSLGEIKDKTATISVTADLSGNTVKNVTLEAK